MALIPDKWRKRTSYFLFALAIAFALPPFFPFGEIFSDLLLNFPTATFIASKIKISLIVALSLTYTLVPILLIWIASIIHPSDTLRTFNGFFTKLKNLIKNYILLVKKQPIHLLWVLLAIYLLWVFFNKFYLTELNMIINAPK